MSVIEVCPVLIQSDSRVIRLYGQDSRDDSGVSGGDSLDHAYTTLITELGKLYAPPSSFRGNVLVLTTQMLLASQCMHESDIYHDKQKAFLQRVERARSVFSSIEVRYVSRDFIVGYSSAVGSFLAIADAMSQVSGVRDVPAAREMLRQLYNVADERYVGVLLEIAQTGDSVPL